MIAIIITIMVLDLRVPHGATLGALRPLFPVFLSYVLSFINVGIYWNNHHHMLSVAERVNGTILWANMHLLFWLSLLPFTAAWLGENHFAPAPTATYGVVLLAAALAYTFLQMTIQATQGPDSVLRAAVGRDTKGKLSLVLYLAAIIFAFVRPWIADTLYVAVALMWLLPDPRIERAVSAQPGESGENRPGPERAGLGGASAPIGPAGRSSAMDGESSGPSQP